PGRLIGGGGEIQLGDLLAAQQVQSGPRGEGELNAVGGQHAQGGGIQGGAGRLQRDGRKQIRGEVEHEGEAHQLALGIQENGNGTAAAGQHRAGAQRNRRGKRAQGGGADLGDGKIVRENQIVGLG